MRSGTSLVQAAPEESIAPVALCASLLHLAEDGKEIGEDHPRRDIGFESNEKPFNLVQSSQCSRWGQVTARAVKYCEVLVEFLAEFLARGDVSTKAFDRESAERRRS